MLVIWLSKNDKINTRSLNVSVQNDDQTRGLLLVLRRQKSLNILRTYISRLNWLTWFFFWVNPPLSSWLTRLKVDYLGKCGDLLKVWLGWSYSLLLQNMAYRAGLAQKAIFSYRLKERTHIPGWTVSLKNFFYTIFFSFFLKEADNVRKAISPPWCDME